MLHSLVFIALQLECIVYTHFIELTLTLGDNFYSQSHLEGIRVLELF